jgi:hypothetical protein
VLTVLETRASFFCLIAIILTVSPLAIASTASPAIRLNESKSSVTVDVTGLSKESLASLARLGTDADKWAKLFAVYVDRPGKDRKDQPAILGSYRIEKGVLRFEPRFPLARGVSYRAVFDPSSLPGDKDKKAQEVLLSLPRPASKPTTVVAQVYPSSDVLPENLLRFYIHFSAPMSQGESYRHIKLLNAASKAIDLPFLELDQELWDPTGKRFTLFFDPGRIKRGLKPREDVGPALEEGKRYTLVIDRTWSDAEGNPLKDTFRKSFRVVKPDDEQPSTKTWKLKPPAAGTRSALRINFPKSMDHALLHRLLWVTDSGGKKLAGNIEVSERENVWLFTPERPWTNGAYNIVVDTRLEDVSGNSIARPFEVDVLRRVQREIKTETVKVGFRVTAGERRASCPPE